MGPPFVSKGTTAQNRKGTTNHHAGWKGASTFNLGEGPVTLTLPADLSLDSYNDLADYFELFLRKAKRHATQRAAELAAKQSLPLVPFRYQIKRPPTEAALLLLIRMELGLLGDCISDRFVDPINR
jgi:hypothetical protein